MPSNITHQLISEEALALLKEPVKGAVLAHPDYYFLGAQGPDVLFFYMPLARREINLGKYLHRAPPYEIFCFFRQYLRSLTGVERARVAAYLAGYLSHYAADVCMHPFVYRLLDEGAQKLEHQRIETDWDEYFAGALRAKSSERWRFFVSAKKINREGTLFALYAALGASLGRTIKKRRLARGLLLAERYLKFFHKKPRRKGFLRLEKLFRLPPVLSACAPRKEIDARYLEGALFERLSGTQRVDELFADAVRRTAVLWENFFSHEQLSPALYCLDFYGRQAGHEHNA